MTVNEAAKALEVSTGTVYALCRCGKLPHERHGMGRGAIRITERQLAEYREGVSRGGPDAEIRPIRGRAAFDWREEMDRIYAPAGKSRRA